MSKQVEFQQCAKSIEALVGKLEGAADPSVRSAARDLVQSLMELHGGGIERMLQIVHDAGGPGAAIMDCFGRDELVRSVLLLYGLHPQDLRTRAAQALEGAKAFLKSSNATAELISIDDAGAVTVQFRAKSGGCGSGAASIKARIEAILQDAAPDATSIVLEDTSEPSLAGSSFVSIGELRSGQAMAALQAPRAQRSGD